ncbi:MAG: PcfJ domain-containing protein [Clostridia bacterium]|nr:PcfJ domain-containing protein [Clostridia bacterium]
MSENVQKDDFLGMPEIPQYIYDKIDEGFHKYLFFETIKKGHRRYTCTACHKSFDEGELVLRDLMSTEDFALFHARHNDDAECPLCGVRGTVKNIKMCDVGKFREVGCRVVFLAPTEDDVWLRAVWAERDYYNRDGVRHINGKTEFHDVSRFHLQPGKSYAWRYRWYYGGYSHEKPHNPFFWHHALWNERYPYRFINGTERGIENTFLRYHSSPFGEDSLVQYLCHYARHPQLEMMVKLGHRAEVADLVFRNDDNGLNWNAKKPWEVYGITHAEYNEWRKGEPSLRVLNIYKRIHGKCAKDFEFARTIDKCSVGLMPIYSFIARAREYKVKPQELLRYVQKVQESSGGACWHCPGITLRQAFDLYMDYMELAKKLGVKKSISPMPKDLKKEHDRLLGVKDRQKLKRQRKEAERWRKQMLGQAASEAVELEKKYPKITKFYEKTAAKYAYTGAKYAVVVPTCIKDILFDGKELGHCVGRAWERYLDRIRSGESFLLFVRMAKKPNVPYYTIEVEPGGTVRQKRTYNDTQDHNIGEITAFLAEWQVQLQDKLTDKERAAAEESRVKREEGFAELRQNKVIVRNGHLQGQLLADVLEADLLEVGFAQAETKKKAVKAKERKAV